MSKIAIIGECMVEMYQDKKSLYKQAFGGDTFNCAVYLKRSLKKADIEYITVLGEDELSEKMIDFVHQQKIKTSFVDKLKEKNIGLYILSNNSSTRTVSYWRENSAAKELFLTRSFNRISSELLDYDLIYFSAITLAIMSEEGRNNLFKILKKARALGVKVAFDSKYRAELYPSSDTARSIYNKAIHYCDIFLSSSDDEKELCGEVDSFSVIKKIREAGCEEIVIKTSNEEVMYCDKNFTKNIKLKQIKKIVDVTSARDSFNAAYLASRIKGKDIEKSVNKANKLSSQVVLYKGAISPK